LRFEKLRSCNGAKVEEFVERFCNATALIVNSGGGEVETGMKRERQMLEGNGESKGKWENSIVKREPKRHGESIGA
jgi:hypothetical protein